MAEIDKSTLHGAMVSRGSTEQDFHLKGKPSREMLFNLPESSITSSNFRSGPKTFSVGANIS
ncbi:UNVERIFIED_CONTAM: hypothetical protein Sangu_1559000 [Sesamum angustifolium]|uniref:Uncharacterized protein n=1 Tax=Sesamum angustifolium TaxID=2727405 RepID=A0AAW2MTZ8_9LAMI